MFKHIITRKTIKICQKIEKIFRYTIIRKKNGTRSLIILNSCWRNTDKSFHKRLLKILQPNFEVIEPVYGCKEDKNSWCYLNYLQLPNAILLPVLSEKADCENDVAAIEYFKGLFPLLKIVPIYALPLIKKGGALHCVTWEYIEPQLPF